MPCPFHGKQTFVAGDEKICSGCDRHRQQVIVARVWRIPRASQALEHNFCRAQFVDQSADRAAWKIGEQLRVARRRPELLDLFGACHQSKAPVAPCVQDLSRRAAPGTQSAQQNIGVEDDEHLSALRARVGNRLRHEPLEASLRQRPGPRANLSQRLGKSVPGAGRLLRFYDRAPLRLEPRLDRFLDKLRQIPLAPARLAKVGTQRSVGFLRYLQRPANRVVQGKPLSDT